MNKLQSKLLNLLKEIDHISNKAGVEWYLMYGTLLGAIRHQGFIPWDDDADIVMTNENYIRFKNYVLSHPQLNRRLSCVDINSNDCGQPMARYHDLENEQILRLNSIYKEQNGIYVDILILDNYPNSELKKNEYDQLLLNFLEYSHKRYSSTFFQRGKVDKFFLKFKLAPKTKIINTLIEKLSTIGEQDSTLLIQRYAINHIYRRSDLGKPNYVKFEDTMLPVPANYHDVLVEQYGEEWNSIPKTHITHEDNTLTANKTQYINITNEFYRNKNELINIINHAIFKQINYKFLTINREIQYLTREAIGSMISHRVKKLNNCSNFVNRYPSLAGLIIYFQFSPRFIGRLKSAGYYNWYSYNNVYIIDLPEEAFISITQFLLNHGKIDHAKRYIENINNESQTSKIKLFSKEIKQLCSINKYTNIKQYDKAKDIIEGSMFKFVPTSLLEKYIQQINYFSSYKIASIGELDYNDGDNLFFLAVSALQCRNISSFLIYFYLFSQKGSNSILLFEAIRILITQKTINNLVENYILDRVLYNLYKAIGFDSINSWKLLNTEIEHKNFIDVNQNESAPFDSYSAFVERGFNIHISSLLASKKFLIKLLLNYVKKIGVDLISVGQLNNDQQSFFIIRNSDLSRFFKNLHLLDPSIKVDHRKVDNNSSLVNQINLSLKGVSHATYAEVFSQLLNDQNLIIYIAKPVSNNFFIRNLTLFFEKVNLLQYSKCQTKISSLHGIFFYLVSLFNTNILNKLLNHKPRKYKRFVLWVNNSYCFINRSQFDKIECLCVDSLYYNVFSASALKSKQLKKILKLLNKKYNYMFKELIHTDFVHSKTIESKISTLSKIYKRWLYFFYFRSYMLKTINKNYDKLSFNAAIINQYALFLENEEYLANLMYTKNDQLFREEFKNFAEDFKKFYRLGYILLCHEDIKPYFIYYFSKIEKNRKIENCIDSITTFKYQLNPENIDNQFLK